MSSSSLQSNFSTRLQPSNPQKESCLFIYYWYFNLFFDFVIWLVWDMILLLKFDVLISLSIALEKLTWSILVNSLGYDNNFDYKEWNDEIRNNFTPLPLTLPKKQSIISNFFIASSQKPIFTKKFTSYFLFYFPFKWRL